MPPSEYHNRCRVERAYRILSINHEKTITDVAFECGFSSSQYFATAFRQHLGMAPNLSRKAGHRRATRRLLLP
jgi:AraC-like DNA-binding protein